MMSCRKLSRVSRLAVALCILVGLAWTAWIGNYLRSVVSLDQGGGAPAKATISLVLDDPETKKEAEVVLPDFIDENPPQEGSDKITRYLHELHLTPPSTKPYNLDPKMGRYSYSDINGQLRNLFRNQNNGFFVEAGANDGQFLSNTLRLEMEQKWTGLLVEPNPFMVPALRLTNRRAWIADVCLSTVGHPVKIRFLHQAGNVIWNRGQGVIENNYDVYSRCVHGVRNRASYIFAGGVDCFPLETLLLALNRTVVDYFSFDVEGVEYKVLQKYPFDQITFKVISVEHNLIPEGYEALEKLLTSNKYKVVFQSAQDVIAVHEDYLQEYSI